MGESWKKGRFVSQKLGRIDAINISLCECPICRLGQDIRCHKKLNLLEFMKLQLNKRNV